MASIPKWGSRVGYDLEDLLISHISLHNLEKYSFLKYAKIINNGLYQTEGFDPGSERTLAAWIRHASRARTVVLAIVLGDSGERVSNK